MKKIAAVIAALTLGACVTTETAEFKPSIGQEAIIRDGSPALISKKQNSIVLARPASRKFQIGARPVYVIAVMNAGLQPTLLSVGNIKVQQMRDGEPITDLKVFTYDDLLREEQARQVVAAILVGVAAGASAAAAANAGNYRSTSTIYTPHGSARIYTTGYSPAAAAIAQSNAAANSTAMMSAAVERGQQNMVVLEQQVLKDNTVMPGEWVGGQVHFAPPANDAAGKFYRISVTVGTDVHEIDVAQQAAGS